MALPERYGIDKKINSMAGLSAYQNGGPGSGDFGHGGRPGKVGGSSKGTSATPTTASEDKQDFDAEGYTSSTKEFDRLFSAGDNFVHDGENFKVVEGEHGLQGVSDDGKRVISTPGDTLDGTTKYMTQGENPSKRLDAYGEIVFRLREWGMPKMLGEEIMRYAAAEHDFAGSSKDKGKAYKSLKSYAETARGAIKGYAKGNGGVNKQPSKSMQRWLKALSDQIKYSERSASDIMTLQEKDKREKAAAAAFWR